MRLKKEAQTGPMKNSSKMERDIMIDQISKMPAFSSLFPQCPCGNDLKNFDIGEEHKECFKEGITVAYAYCRNCSRRTGDLENNGLTWDEICSKLVLMWVVKYGV